MAKDRWVIEIANGSLTAAINPLGAELSRLRDAQDRELMTDADPAFWTGRAPLLFPIVGALNHGEYRLDGQRYAMPQHGFARRQHFAVVEQAADRAHFRLTDNDATRKQYPFAFALDAAFALSGATLSVAITVTNRDTRAMPASFGFHPAFAWPLPYGEARGEHRVLFDQPEPEPICHLIDGLIAPDTRPSPIVGQALPLADASFANDALIWDRVASRSVRYGAGKGPQLAIDFPDTPSLGIWTKPGAPFVCIEPWHGLADPQGFAGEIWDKPGMLHFEPGEARSFTMRVTLRT